MTRSNNREESPWWESELPLIRDEQVAYLRRRLPSLRADHDDLVSETLLALTKQIRSHSSALPRSWFQSNSQPKDDERSHLHKLAMVILKRRIADLFRGRLARSGRSSARREHWREVPDPQAPPLDQNILLRRVLQVTLSVLDEMQPEDRDLIALVSEEADFRKALNDRERQRLHRLRKRLKDEIARQLGAEVSDLLRIKL